MSVAEVAVSAAAGPVSVRVTERRRPGGVVTLVWRFDGERRQGIVGEIRRELREVPLGGPASLRGSGFVIDGYVVPVAGRAPAPYQVTVTVLQDGREVHQAVPPDHGVGLVGAEEVRFRYPFVLRVV